MFFTVSLDAYPFFSFIGECFKIGLGLGLGLGVLLMCILIPIAIIYDFCRNFRK